MSTWTNIQQKTFLVDILKMNISRKCWGNFYHFKQDSLLGFGQQIFIKGLIIENDVPTTGRDTFVDQNSVRRVYN